MGIKVAQFNVLLESQLRNSLVISQIPVESGWAKVTFGGAPHPILYTPLKSAYAERLHNKYQTLSKSIAIKNRHIYSTLLKSNVCVKFHVFGLLMVFSH